MAIVLRGTVTIKDTPGSGGSDPLLARNPSSGTVESSTPGIPSTLTDGYIFVGNASNVATGVLPSGDITLTNAGVFGIATGVIVDSDINSSAAIATTKLATLTASKAVATNSSGFLVASTTTNAELAFVSGVTSAIQTQLNTKQVTITGAATSIVTSDLTPNFVLVSDPFGKVAISTITTSKIGFISNVTSDIQAQLSDLILGNATSSIAKTPSVTQDGFTLVWDNVNNQYTLRSVSAAGVPDGGTLGQYLIKASNSDQDTEWSTLVLSNVTDVFATFNEVNALSGLDFANVGSIQFNYLTGLASNVQTQLSTTINGLSTSSLVQNPTNSENDFSITWDNLNSLYTLKPRNSGGGGGDRWATFSNTTLTIVGSGNILFTVETGLAYTTGQLYVIAVTGDPLTLMEGLVVSYNPLTGAFSGTVDTSTGSGTFSSWAVNLQAGVISPPSNIYGGASPTNITVGGLAAGTAIGGSTYDSIIEQMTQFYFAPTFSSFSITGQAALIEVGTALSGTKTFTWSTTNSGNVQVNSIAIRDVNTNTLIGSGLANDGTEALAIGTITNTSPISQSWRVEGTNTNAGSMTPLAFTVNSIYPVFYGKVASGGAPPGGSRPTANQSLINSGTKTLVTSTGTVTLNFNSGSDDYFWFAIPSTSTSKTTWFISSLNNGLIGGSVNPGGNLFPDPDVVTINSPTSLWSSISYKIYITNFQSAVVVAMELRN